MSVAVYVCTVFLSLKCSHCPVTAVVTDKSSHSPVALALSLSVCLFLTVLIPQSVCLSLTFLVLYLLPSYFLSKTNKY